MPTDFTSYQQIGAYMLSKGLFEISNMGEIIGINVKDIGDNTVGFMSQIGWTENIGVGKDRGRFCVLTKQFSFKWIPFF